MCAKWLVQMIVILKLNIHLTLKRVPSGHNGTTDVLSIDGY